MYIAAGHSTSTIISVNRRANTWIHPDLGMTSNVPFTLGYFTYDMQAAQYAQRTASTRVCRMHAACM